MKAGGSVNNLVIGTTGKPNEAAVAELKQYTSKQGYNFTPIASLQGRFAFRVSSRYPNGLSLTLETSPNKTVKQLKIDINRLINELGK